MFDDNHFGFKVGDLDLIITVIQKYPQIEQTIIFGSRAKGNYKTGSDVDIALKGDINWQIVSSLNDELNEETNLPYMFDILDYNSIDNIALREHINRVGVVFYERKKALKQGWEFKKLGDVCDKCSSNVSQNTIETLDGIYPIFGAKGFIKNVDFYHQSNPYIGIIKDGAGVGRVMLLEGFSSVIATMQYLIPKENINIKYFYYFLLSMNFTRYINGSTIPHIYFKDYKEEPFLLLPLLEQQKIVAILDKAFSAIEQAKQHAEKNLKNAKELFNNYLQNIDAKMVALSELVNITTGRLNSNEAVDNGKYPFFTCSREVFSINKYAFDLEAILLAGNNASGDFNVKHYKGKFNAYQRTYIITVNEKLNVLYRYLYFQLLNSLKEFKNQSVGANTRFLKIGMIYNLQIPLPSIKEQNQIIYTLDNLLSKTQQLEAIYQHKLTKLEELKKSILQKAFNGEING